MKDENSHKADSNLGFAGKGPTTISRDCIALVEPIRDSGSITLAAKAAGISYKSAWNAVAAVNNLAECPLVEASTGGRRGGGTRLTEYGRELIQVYRAAEAEFEAFSPC